MRNDGVITYLDSAIYREPDLFGRWAKIAYTPHSLRATAATLLLDSGVDIMEVKELLGHRHVTTTQIYDKRRRAAREGASHKMPL
jgi:integrase